MNQSALLEVGNGGSIQKKIYPWKFRARVISLWHVPEHILPLSTSSMDMVLIDREGVKFEASVSKSVTVLPKIFEGRVYQISFFRILDNIGTKRYTNIRYRLLFESCTKIYPAVDHDIPHNGCDFIHMDHIKLNGNTFGYFIDVIGLLAAASSEKLMIKDNRVYKTMEIELLDRSGMITCVLVGDIVDNLSEYLCADWIARPVVGLRYVEVRRTDGHIRIHGIPYVTKILINHNFEEHCVLASRFDGIDMKLPVEYIPNGDENDSIHADMLNLHPKKTIPEVLISKEKGIFVVRACIVSLLKDREWWYPSCRCYTELERGHHVFRCNRCFRTIEKFMHRYSFKVEVDDGLDSTVFVLNHREAMQLINIPCEELIISQQGKPSLNYPPQLEEKLVGKDLLFKIRVGFGMTYNRQDIYEVLRISDDAELIKIFTSEKLFSTPLKAKFAPPFIQLEDVDDKTKVPKNDAGYFKSKVAAGVMRKVVRNSSAICGQSSTTTSIHRSLKRKLEGEFDTFVSEIAEDVEAIDALLKKRIEQKYGVNAGPQSSPVKTDGKCLQKAEVGVAVNKSAASTKSTMNIAEDIISADDIEQKLKCTQIIDLTHDNEDFEISPTQVATMSQSFDVTDITKMDKNGEVTSKEFIDLTEVEDEVEDTSIENSEEVEVWEIIDLST